MGWSVAAWVKGTYESETTEVLLNSSTDVLLGVDAEAARVLANLSINTVFDLASSHLFNSAYKLAINTEGETSVFDHVGAIPRDIVDAAHHQKSPTAIAFSSIDVLKAIGPANRDDVRQALMAETVRDLGRWPPFRASRKILSQAFSIGGEEIDDPDAPDELVPIARRYATESFKFERVFFDKVDEGSGSELRPLTGSAALDIRSLRLDDSQALSPATGALLSFEQTWKPQGLSLGQLLSSVALAPGESTKIAVVDWSRRVATAATEDVTERDRIQAQLGQSRATSEIQSLTAEEMAHGKSYQATESEAYSEGYSNGGGLLGLLVPIGSTNSAYGTNRGSTVTVASSSGKRDLAAEMTQEIQSNTRQASTAVRSRRASVVSEVETSEREEIRTRILTNYNHSHALTIQYYETIQIYRTQVRLAKVDRVLFVPIKTIDFRDPAVIAQFKFTLINAISDSEVRRSLASFVSDIVLQEANTFRAKPMSYRAEGALFLKSIGVTTSAMINGNVKMILQNRGGDKQEVAFTSDGARRLESPLALSDLVSITANYSNYSGDLAQHMDIFLVIAPEETMAGSKVLRFKSGLTGSLQPGSNQPARESQVVIQAYSESMDPNTIDYLQEHALPLSQAVWASLTQQQLATVLGSFEFKGDPLLEVVDVSPVTFFGNYLVLKYYPPADTNDDEWNAWQEQHLGSESMSVQEDLIPVPSDGLFAEAVLGRFNASEKIDMTRFWDWQESPIPMQAPDIGPIVPGQHVSGTAQLPGQLGAPIIGMQQPQQLPAPTGLTALISAAQSDLFRDMSGLQETASTLRSSIGESSELASNAGKLANELEAIKQKTVGKLAELAAQAGMAAAGVPPVGALGTGSAGGGSGSAPRYSIPSQMESGPAASMSNTTRGGLLNESLKLDDSLLQMPDLDWPAAGEDGSHTDTTLKSIRGKDPKPKPESVNIPPVDDSTVKEKFIESTLMNRMILANFDVNSAELKTDHKSALVNLADIIGSEGLIHLVQGHASEAGSEEDNAELSKLRAASVRNFLLNNLGVDARQIVTEEGVGETQPLNISGPLEDPSERAVMLTFQVQFETPAPTLLPESNVSAEKHSDWSIRVKYSAGSGSSRIKMGGAKFEVELKHRSSGTLLGGHVAAAGVIFGLKLLDAAKAWTPWMDFETDIPLSVDKWHGQWVRVGMLQSAIFMVSGVLISIAFPGVARGVVVDEWWDTSADTGGNVGVEVNESAGKLFITKITVGE